MTYARLFRVTGLLAVLMLVLAACASGEDAAGEAASEAADLTTSEVASEPMVEETSSEMASDLSSEMATSECQLEPLPSEGAGSVDMMAEEPAATAASGNPNLSTLVQAVEAAGLVDTLNSEGPFTIFAPANCAFDAIPEADLNALLADTDTLTEVLTYHVVQGEALTAADLTGMDTVTTVQGQDIMLAVADDTLSLNDGTARVIAADVQVGNGVVHVIDWVLMPPSS